MCICEYVYYCYNDSGLFSVGKYFRFASRRIVFYLVSQQIGPATLVVYSVECSYTLEHATEELKREVAITSTYV